MSRSLRIAVTADLHWGHRHGADATRLLVSFLQAQPPDLLILAGDLGTGPLFAECLQLFDGLSCQKALVPGNHDLWVQADNAPYDSLQLYHELLPADAARHGFHYLDAAPLVLSDAGLTVVGSVNWYDYSWGLEAIRQAFPQEEYRVRSMRFTRGRHNDANFVRWPLDDIRFTDRVVTTLSRHLETVQTERAIVVAHHPPFYELSFPDPPEPDLDNLLWRCFAGNRRFEEVLSQHAKRIALAFCGHTHWAREATLESIRGYNVGGNYHFKRLLWLEWPGGEVVAHQFGKTEGRESEQ
jgi:hypothetical protein